MSSLFERLIPPGPGDDVEAFHQGTLFVVASVLTGLFAAGYAGLHAYVGFSVGAATLAVVTVAFFALPPLFRRTGSVAVVAHLFLLVGTAAIVIATYFSGGREIRPWLVAVPLVAVLLAGKRQGSLWAVAAVVLTALFTGLEQSDYPFPVSLDPGRRPVWEMLVRVGLPLLIFVLALVFQHEKERAFRKLHARNAALEVALRELETTQTQLVQVEKLASLGELTAGIAHELKNPLNFVMNFSALNAERADDLDAVLRTGDGDAAYAILTDIRENARRVHEHGARADGIVRVMTSHARQDRSPRERIELNRLVAEHVALAFPPGRGDGAPEVVVEARYDDAAGGVDVAREEIGRVLLNLLDNARYAACTAPSPPEAPVRPRVWVETARVNGHAEIRVRDNGTGIPPALHARIFEPFFTTKPAGEGTGLGLSLAHDIVRQRHGGTLSVESAVGEGATFVVTLPSASDA